MKYELSKAAAAGLIQAFGQGARAAASALPGRAATRMAKIKANPVGEVKDHFMRRKMDYGMGIGIGALSGRAEANAARAQARSATNL